MLLFRARRRGGYRRAVFILARPDSVRTGWAQKILYQEFVEKASLGTPQVGRAFSLPKTFSTNS